MGLGWQTYGLDYADPSDFLTGLFDHASNGADFGDFEQSDPQWVAAIRHARTLSGQRRLQNYGRLDDTLASRAAPIVGWSTEAARDLFAARVGCQIYQPLYGIDLGSLCLRQ